jgi:membrane associated rhomboid family serine protease
MTVWVSYMPMPLWTAAFFWAIQDILGVFIPDNIANFAHLGGLAFGLVCGFYYQKTFSQKKISKRKNLMLTPKEIEEWEKNNFKF